MPSFSRSLEQALHRALALANERHHEYATLEHLLLALVDDQDAAAVMRACSVDLDTLRRSLVDYIDAELANLVTDGRDDSKPTAGFQRVIQRAVIHVQSSGREEVTGANVLVAMFAERESHAAYFLQEQDMTRYDAVNYISHGIAKRPGAGEARPVRGVEEEPEQQRDSRAADPGNDADKDKKKKESALDAYCVNLNRKARDGRIDPLIGREAEVQRTIQILCRRQKNNPLLVGDPGVGKTAIAEGLALKITRGQVPEVLADATVFSLDMGTLLAGTRYRGDFEERLKQVMKEIEAHPKAIMFIDEIHTVIGAGATSGGAMDASNLLKPALASGGLRCIGSTTYKEYRQYFEKDRALVRRFQKIDVSEPSIPDTVEILKGLKPYFEEFHKLRYTNDAIKAAVELSARYIHDRKLPDKAIDVIDETGASQMLVAEHKRKKTIGVKEIEAAIATMARIPAKTVSKDDAEVLRNLETHAQAHGLWSGEGDRGAILLNQARSRRPARRREADRLLSLRWPHRRRQDRGRPPACHLARRRADPLRHVGIYGAPHRLAADRRASGLCRLRPGRAPDRPDRPASAQRAAARRDREGPSRPVQHPPAGHGSRQADRQQRQAGRFQERHPDHDHQCRRRRHGPQRLWLHPDQKREGDDTEAINKLFAPEFRNRLDSVISFGHLPKTVVARVVDKFVLQLEAQLADRNVTIELSDEAREWLVENGYDEAMGARPMARLIQSDDQDAACRRGAVRPPEERRRGQASSSFSPRPASRCSASNSPTGRSSRSRRRTSRRPPRSATASRAPRSPPPRSRLRPPRAGAAPLARLAKATVAARAMAARGPRPPRRSALSGPSPRSR